MIFVNLLCDINEAFVEMKRKILNKNVKKQKKISKVYGRNYLCKNQELSRKKKISGCDLCDNELSDFEDDEKGSVGKIVEIMRTQRSNQFKSNKQFQKQTQMKVIQKKKKELAASHVSERLKNLKLFV